jgi:hypothetical protein
MSGTRFDGMLVRLLLRGLKSGACHPLPETEPDRLAGPPKTGNSLPCLCLCLSLAKLLSADHAASAPPQFACSRLRAQKLRSAVTARSRAEALAKEYGIDVCYPIASDLKNPEAARSLVAGPCGIWRQAFSLPITASGRSRTCPSRNV